MPKHLTTNDTADFVTSDQLGAVSGVAQLGVDGKVPNSQLPTVATGSVDSVNGHIGNVILDADDVGAISDAQKGAVNGVPQLDSTGRMPVNQLPAAVLTTASMGVANGVATLGSNGKLTSAQVPTAPVTSVNGLTGAVTLTANSVSAIPTTQKAANNGVASLDGNGDVPLAQIPSLLTLYQPVPSVTPTKPGQGLTAIAGGSNSVQWTEPLTYSASSAGGMPSGVPSGSLCTRTDQRALYEYVSGAWVAIVPPVSTWVNITLPGGIRGYNNNDPAFFPQVRKIGSQVWLRGRYETTSGANIGFGQTITLPAGYASLTILDLVGTASTGGGGVATSRFQLQLNGDLVYYTGTSPYSPWVGFSGTWLTD